MVLSYQPLAVLVEVDDLEYQSMQVPGAADVPPGHFYVKPVKQDSAFFPLEIASQQKINIVRKQAW